ncbi:DUF4422 domain-containing protein [Spirabiliibacterium falconis]|uniref:DUF4422 domain-containing protein n=1 Tax=Spirabiliibacterium falconis TaxID=572023 RepID=UPI001AACF4CA|nr:DUF4422 domain-containing protein [Spirabiliibacterium falconis]MBE2894793.1 DUF4422 domain-containing protein [Spirabiliibacterium falconis]
MKGLVIFIATHKAYSFPSHGSYVPIQVGAECAQADLGFWRDDVGDNISKKNASFCELTALYCIWQNALYSKFDADLIGLNHYRRYFKGHLAFNDVYIAEPEMLSDLLTQYDVIVPKRRNYWIESVYSHYKHAHNIADLDKVRAIIKSDFPDYVDAFDAIMSQKKLALYNMFVMSVDDFNAYCKWLFTILFKIESYIDVVNYDAYQKRVFGFLAERLFNVWLYKQKLKVKELPVVNLEGENLLLKAFNMIRRKLFK